CRRAAPIAFSTAAGPITSVTWSPSSLNGDLSPFLLETIRGTIPGWQVECAHDIPGAAAGRRAAQIRPPAGGRRDRAERQRRQRVTRRHRQGGRGRERHALPAFPDQGEADR